LNDLTVGKPAKVIWMFSLPLLLSMALQQIYNIADSVIVGNFAGADGLAAIGAAYPITLIFIAIATGASMGCSVVIGQLFGSKEMRQLKTAIYTAILSMLVLGVVMALIGVLGARGIMTLLGTPDNVFDDAAAYLAIYAVGVIANFVYNTATAIYTGLGDSRRPLYFLLLSSVLNIVLDYIAVAIWHYGVVGAAWATTISQFVAAILSTAILIRRIRDLHEDEKVPLFSLVQLKEMSRIAVPSIIQQCCVAFSHTLIQRVVNSFGSTVMAGYEAASKVHNFVYMCMNTLGTAFSSFAAQNFGAKKPARIREGFRYSSLMCLAFAALAIAILQLFPASLVGLFLDDGDNAGVIEVGVKYMRIISPDYLLICFIITSGGLLRGIGRIRDFLIVTLLDFFIRISMSYILCLGVKMGYTGLFWAWYFGSAVDLVICGIWYRNMCRKGELAAAS
jgi:putative MATE family efflux protein